MTVPACGPDDGKASRGCRKVIEGSETCRGVEGDIGRFIGWFITLILGKWMQGFDHAGALGPARTGAGGQGDDGHFASAQRVESELAQAGGQGYCTSRQIWE